MAPQRGILSQSLAVRALFGCLLLSAAGLSSAQASLQQPLPAASLTPRTAVPAAPIASSAANGAALGSSGAAAGRGAGVVAATTEQKVTPQVSRIVVRGPSSTQHILPTTIPPRPTFSATPAAATPIQTTPNTVDPTTTYPIPTPTPTPTSTTTPTPTTTPTATMPTMAATPPEASVVAADGAAPSATSPHVHVGPQDTTSQLTDVKVVTAPGDTPWGTLHVPTSLLPALLHRITTGTPAMPAVVVEDTGIRSGLTCVACDLPTTPAATTTPPTPVLRLTPLTPEGLESLTAAGLADEAILKQAPAAQGQSAANGFGVRTPGELGTALTLTATTEGGPAAAGGQNVGAVLLLLPTGPLSVPHTAQPAAPVQPAATTATKQVEVTLKKSGGSGGRTRAPDASQGGGGPGGSNSGNSSGSSSKDNSKGSGSQEGQGSSKVSGSQADQSQEKKDKGKDDSSKSSQGNNSQEKKDGDDSANSSGNKKGQEGELRPIHILHFNDWHNRMEPTQRSWNELCDEGWHDQDACTGGLARMVKWADDKRHELGWDSTLLLNAGDDFIGTVWDRKYRTDQAAHFMRLLRLDASTLGNHEFDWGVEELANYVEKLPHPVLGACNLEIPRGHRLDGRVRTWISKQMAGGVKVCVFGLVTPDTSDDDAWPIKIKDPYYHGKQCVQGMRNDGCQVIILLSHLGYTADIAAGQLIPGLDLVVGGHSHSLLWGGGDKGGSAPRVDKDKGERDSVWGPYPTWVDSKVEGGRKVPVVQAGWGSRYTGHFTLWVHAPEDDPRVTASSGRDDSGSQGRRCDGWCGIKRVEGHPVMLGGRRSDSPYEQDWNVVREIKKWRYWEH